MALLNFEHFDLYGTSAAALLLNAGYFDIGGTAISASNSRNGTHCLSLGHGSGGRGLRYTLPTPRSVVGQGVAWRITALTTGATTTSYLGLRWGNASSASAVRLIPNLDTGGFRLLLGTTEVAASDPGLVAAGSYFWIEGKVTTGTGDASVEVRLNGTTIINATGLTIADPITNVGLASDNSSSGPNALFDDWVVWDTVGGDIVDFMGDTFVLTAAPDADTAVADWSPTPSGSRFATIDEASPDDADYIQSASIGQACEFTHPALNLGVGAIAAVASQTRAFKSDAGAASYATGLKSGTASSMSAEIALATGALVHKHIVERNPDGNVPWTQSAANAARLRVERNA